jgi:hypothetical protein
MFQTPIGGPVGAATKTIELTNMTGAGVIPNGQKMEIKAIKAFYVSQAVKATAGITTLYSWLASATVRLFITGKDSIYTKPLIEVLGIPMLWTTTPTVAGNNEVIMSTGKFHGIDVLSRKITLAELTNFEVRLTWTTALGGGNVLIGDQIKIGLAGILNRRS